MKAIQPTVELSTSLAREDVSLPAPAFWRPRFAGEGEMLLFAPFLFWLTAILRPSRSTVVGLGDGISCFALCQAIDRLHIDGFCTGVGFSEDIPVPIERHAKQLYEGVVDLRLARNPVEALSHLIPGSQDLIVIDLLQSDDWPDDILNELQGRLSPRGCLVLYGLMQVPQCHHVISQLSELSYFTLDIGAGMSLVCNDPTPPADLAGPISHGKLPQQVSMILARLGQSLMAEERHDALMAKMTEQDSSLAEERQRVTTLEAELAEMSVSFVARGRKTSQYQALYFDSDLELKSLRRTQAQILDAEKERQAKEAALVERDDLAAQLRQNRDIHYRETAALTLLLEKQKETAAKETAALREKIHLIKQKVETLRHKVDELTKDVTVLRRKCQELATDNSALLSSTSWRLTSPLRRIAAKVSGRKYHR